VGDGVPRGSGGMDGSEIQKMTEFTHYTCGMCNRGPFATRDDYIEHLGIYHPETWLAQRSRREQETRDKRAKVAALAATHPAPRD
jgi:hypothetical protein